MDLSNKFGQIINEYDDISLASENCNNICNQAIRKTCIDFAEWLLYDDEVFSLYATNKITIDKLFNRFLDESKMY